MYEVVFSEKAIQDILRLRKSEPSAYRKVGKLIEELKIHPTVGTGHPEQLKGNRSGQRSCAVTKKHRLIYEIVNHEVRVDVLSAYGHYDDK
jgi:toxin YoeB